jgi:hypothetical protein
MTNDETSTTTYYHGDILEDCMRVMKYELVGAIQWLHEYPVVIVLVVAVEVSATVLLSLFLFSFSQHGNSYFWNSCRSSGLFLVSDGVRTRYILSQTESTA